MIKINETITVGGYDIMSGESESINKFSDPGKAIEEWFKRSAKKPTCIAIYPSSNSEGKKILQWAVNNTDKIKKWHSQYNSPYKLDWLLSEIDRKSKAVKVIDWDGDQLYPFALG